MTFHLIILTLPLPAIRRPADEDAVMIIRPVAMTDLAALQQIAVESGPGFTSLVDDRDFLIKKIHRSIESFGRNLNTPGDESYLFILEDPETGEVMGTTGIEASVGVRRPLYHYHRSQVVHHSPELNLLRRMETLNMCNHYTGCSEICTLFLRPKFRRAQAGKLLSRVRFLFMAQHPERFAQTVIAEMRGVSDERGQSPFWNWLRAHFVDLEFDTVTRMVGTGDNGFIADLMPRHPLYTHLMDESARAVIGQVHDNTRPALTMLEAEGFRHNGYIDLFDGGPTVEARLSDIRSVSASTGCHIQIVDDVQPALETWNHGGKGRTLAITNTETADFRATVTTAARYLPARNLLQIPAELANALYLRNDGQARFMELAPANAARQPAAIPLRQQKEAIHAHR
ncbi:arginine N-succinyltransferase [Marinobacter sp. TBZ242]|uniref:Arginine N-succinyltransferase n=1 Tax=Marinobacter azerbaijanicus TaxID=3050455 RepID=A0ABT7IGE6_9GAMM|nr:arginine N-succinyltransferase [Marinobacter sp. TBZ242]MDL0432228.1 arginine N-succinyltransferase [Marinobacter sp. TBZ242]